MAKKDMTKALPSFLKGAQQMGEGLKVRIEQDGIVPPASPVPAPAAPVAPMLPEVKPVAQPAPARAIEPEIQAEPEPIVPSAPVVSVTEAAAVETPRPPILVKPSGSRIESAPVGRALADVNKLLAMSLEERLIDLAERGVPTGWENIESEAKALRIPKWMPPNSLSLDYEAYQRIRHAQMKTGLTATILLTYFCAVMIPKPSRAFLKSFRSVYSDENSILERMVSKRDASTESWRAPIWLTTDSESTRQRIRVRYLEHPYLAARWKELADNYGREGAASLLVKHILPASPVTYAIKQRRFR